LTAAGELAQIVNGESFQFLVAIEFRYDGPESAPRGNHVHRRKTETLYVLRGHLRAAYKDLETGEAFEFDLPEGSLVTVEPNCAHAYTPLEHTLAIEFSATPYDPADTEPYALN
jgi:mannose-6-phosphate isomerase-like protein (cupin superfamily)